MSNIYIYFRLLHTSVLSNNTIKSPVVLGNYALNPAPILYRGIGHTVDDENVLALKILRGNPSTYTVNLNSPRDVNPESIGRETLLVSALQVTEFID